ncbi:MAG: tRNA dihydrouridine synthase DusB [Candidatus Omnitrophota bacterium]|nr:tRNA dihydrouridine synthase DusB [Candidatus Omnitrophota bacterium]MBU1928503.1 tRNA dihydrouridine synthase DusB [Candidatus Omnitrophota bacterium]MBU2034724.1 tRNA dihydrouridine synthase DusB [Candidatus Omnitrophota bacterium]MBU2221857.1 tRNA dihydrouridine synthase DusB [Candidatus Omnitrophota bacterium]
MLKIGNLKLKSNLILAPMSGITDLPYRLLNRRFGCEMAFVEMLNVRSISYKSRKTHQMLASDPKDKPLGVQLLGNDPKFILKAMETIIKYKFACLDFNAACPERKVVRRGEGASLLKDPRKLSSLLKILVQESPYPVTVKIRSGWDKHSVNAKETALYCQDAGIKALFIHGRTREQGYSGQVDYTIIREVKKALDIPVIASGDILSAELAKRMFDETACDGILIARGSFGNPWIFREIEEYIKKGKIIPKPEAAEVAKVMRGHFKACLDFYDQRTAIAVFRKFFSWYTKGRSRTRPLREKACQAKTPEGMLEVIEEFHRNQK